MRLTKLDLSNLLAVGHADGQLGLLIDRGESIEYVEVEAPVFAYLGLQQVNEITTEPPALPPSVALSPLNSSMARAAGYDPQHQRLQIEFHNGSLYQYEAVDAQTWEDLQTTDSPGRFFNEAIRGQYRSCRLDSDDCC